MKKQSQNGIAHLGLLLLMLVVVVIALIGYKVAKDQKTVTSSNPTAQVQAIKSKADLGSAETTLNQASLDKDLNPASLDNDVNSLL
jgi:Tfp pilus assembly protein PilX